MALYDKWMKQKTAGMASGDILYALGKARDIILEDPWA